MHDELFECCPICDDTWYIRREVVSGRHRGKRYICDKCGFHSDVAATWGWARRKWNRNAKKFKDGYDQCKAEIRKLVEGSLKHENG